MRLDLRSIIHVPGASLPFQFELDLSGLDFYGERPFTQPAQVSGSVRNMADALLLTGTAQTPAADDAQAQQAQNSMKFMNYFFPIFTLILCFNYNAIFALYWVASIVIAIVQTKGINMYLDRKEALEAANPNKNTGSLK